MGKASDWRTLSIQPLSGGLDVRSVPADIPPGYFRWKLNAKITPEGKLGRREGWSRAWNEALYDDAGIPLSTPGSGVGVNYHNHDHHFVGDTREPITFLQEITWGDKTRSLFDGTQSRIGRLDEANGTWSDIVTGMGTYGTYWTAAFLQDTIIFTNDYDGILAYPKGGPAAAIPELVALNITKARIAIEFNGFVLLMNLEQDGERQASRICWCDLNLPLSWTIGAPNSVAGYQDLDYGDEILAASYLLGAVYVYTRRKIWRITVSGTDIAFNFQDVYAEPKNQTGCIAYPRTLVSTGSAHYYASRDGIYRFSPFVAAPVRDDWLHRASGVMYTKADTAMSGVICNLPVSEYRPDRKELWFSWPGGVGTVNNWCLVAQTDHETADIVDHGFTAFCNYRSTPIAAALCNEVQSFLGASGEDYCLKDIGNGYVREMCALSNNDPSVDVPEDANDLYYEDGYYTIVRGMIPTGYFDREKIVGNVLLEDSTLAEATPCDVRLRLGNSYALADPNDEGTHCTVFWRDCGAQKLHCPEPGSVAVMQAQNLRPSYGKEFPVYEQGRFLFYEFRVQNADGTAAKGCATYWQRFDFKVMAQPG